MTKSCRVLAAVHWTTPTMVSGGTADQPATTERRTTDQAASADALAAVLR